MDPQSLPADYGRRLSRVDAAARAVGDEVRATRGDAASPDGAVRATVSSTGALERLRLGSSGAFSPPDELAAAILRTVQDARTDAAATASRLIETELRAPAPTHADLDEDDSWTRA